MTVQENWKNILYFGDNLGILRDTVLADSVDLVYLDPPFNSKASYNVLFQERSGEQSAAQITAFEDTWHWGSEAEREFHEVVTKGPKNVSDLMQAFRTFLGQNDMMAYITMMAPRLIQLHRVLKNTGSIYLHCDPTASHYLKLVMDAVFGPTNFRSEVIWRRTGSHNSARRYGPIHDTILFYTKSKEYFWKRQYGPYLEGYVKTFFNKTDERGPFRSQTLTGSGTRNGESGQPWRGYNPTPKGRHWAFPGVLMEELGLDEDLTQHQKLDALLEEGYIAPSEVDGLPEYRQYLAQSKGLQLQDIWAYQPYTNGALHGTSDPIDGDVRWLDKRGGDERLNYPTQKPEGLLERIISSSSEPGDLVLDPFCGCGTTIAVAERLKRRWIGIDITHLAIALMKYRLQSTFLSELAPYEVHGTPTDPKGAEALALEDRYKFQTWAVSVIDAQPAQEKKGADEGIDGYVYFDDEGKSRYKKILVQVKSGHVSSRDIRDLNGTRNREGAEIAIFITLEDPTGPMSKEALSAGYYETAYFPDKKFPRIQILTVEELLKGTRPEYPDLNPGSMFKRAPFKGKTKEEQQKLL